jgi:hypothetical protein
LVQGVGNLVGPPIAGATNKYSSEAPLKLYLKTYSLNKLMYKMQACFTTGLELGYGHFWLLEEEYLFRTFSYWLRSTSEAEKKTRGVKAVLAVKIVNRIIRIHQLFIFPSSSPFNNARATYTRISRRAIN